MPASFLSNRFGSVVRQHRVGIGMSQERLAELAKLHPTYVSMVERGIRNPTLNVAARLAKSLGHTLSELIEEAENS